MINVAMKNEKKEKKIEPVLLSEYVSLSLSTLDNSWTSKPIIAVIAPGLCTNVLLGLPFLVHNHIVVDHELPSAIVKDTSVDLLNFVPAPKKILKIQKSPHRKRIEIRLLHRDLLKELKWRCAMIKKKLDRMSERTQDNDDEFIAVNFISV